MRKGSKYALVVGDKLYTLESGDKNRSVQLDKLAGEQAQVTGTVDADTSRGKVGDCRQANSRRLVFPESGGSRGETESSLHLLFVYDGHDFHSPLKIRYVRFAI